MISILFILSHFEFKILFGSYICIRYLWIVQFAVEGDR